MHGQIAELHLLQAFPVATQAVAHADCVCSAQVCIMSARRRQAQHSIC